MRLSDLQMSRLRDSTDGLHQRYLDITFHAAQAEEFDAQMTITSVVEPLVGRYITDPGSSLASEPAAAFQSAIGDAMSQWRVITGSTPSASAPHLEPMPDGRT